MWAVYVDDPIGYQHLICECRNPKDAKQCVYQWARLSKFWKQWTLDYLNHNLLWQVLPSKGRNMPEIFGNSLHDVISRYDWEEVYDHTWSYY
jgi:hypothetical protein